MSGYSYNSYISSLNSPLSPANSPTLPQADDLAVWSDTQFTFDIPPGMGIYDDEIYKQQHSSSLEAKGAEDPDPDPVTYERLVDYLDYELPQKQDHHHQQQIAPIPHGATVHPHERHNSTSHAQTTATILQPFVIAHATPMINTRIAPAPKATTPITTSFPAIIPATYIAAATTTTNMNPMAVAPDGSLLLAKHPYMTISALSSAPSKRRHGSIDLTMLASNSSPPAEQVGSPESDDGSVETDGTSKLAAEEDKRRRNTAASARFRIKKKQREQALERTAREMNEKAETLETRVRELEMENKWLRGLIVEKDSRLLDMTEEKAPGPGEEQAAKTKADGEEAK